MYLYFNGFEAMVRECNGQRDIFVSWAILKFRNKIIFREVINVENIVVIDIKGVQRSSRMAKDPLHGLSLMSKEFSNDKGKG